MPHAPSAPATSTTPPVRGRLGALLLLAAAWSIAPGASAQEPIVIQGSTTFSNTLMVDHKARIEELSGQRIAVQPNKSSAGLVGLAEGRARMSMLSALLEAEMPEVEKLKPGLSFDGFKSHEISRTRVAFAVHPTNRVRSATLEDIRRILAGEVTNWRALGGEDLPIRLVLIRAGGGVQMTVNAQVLKGRPIGAPDPIQVNHGSQVIKIVAQEPGALGFAQLKLLQAADLPEIATDKIVEQVLSYVTVGDPSPEIARVIAATRQIAEEMHRM